MSDLTKLTVNLIPKAVAALDLVADRSGFSRTDIVNRALQLYNAIQAAAANGGGVELTPSDETFVVYVAVPDGH